MAATIAIDPWAWRPVNACRRRPVSLLRLQGPDTLRVLHGQTSQAIADAPPGALRSSCCLTPTGRVRALLEVLVDELSAWLVVSEGDGSTVHQALDRVLFPADRVELGDPEPAELIEPLEETVDTCAGGEGWGTGAENWQPLDSGQGWWLGQRLLLRPGAEWPEPLKALRVLDALESERWRLQQGLPAAPGELDGDSNPFELGLADRVSLIKGCYLGQETLARLVTYNGVRQQLRRWCAPLPAAAGLHPGSRLLTDEGERAGRITSCLALEPEGLVIGLALVRREALELPELWAAAGDDSDQLLHVQVSRPPTYVDPPES